MAIISVPNDISLDEAVECQVCKCSVLLAQATAGLRTVDNQQAFACNVHFQSGGQYIVGWVDFAALQRERLLYEVNSIGCGSEEYEWAIC